MLKVNEGKTIVQKILERTEHTLFPLYYLNSSFLFTLFFFLPLIFIFHTSLSELALSTTRKFLRGKKFIMIRGSRAVLWEVKWITFSGMWSSRRQHNRMKILNEIFIKLKWLNNLNSLTKHVYTAPHPQNIGCYSEKLCPGGNLKKHHSFH